MADIFIQHEKLAKYKGKVLDYTAFFEHHNTNVNSFKEITNFIFKDVKGKITFDYITKYSRFDLLEHPEEVNQNHLMQIEEKYPNCFI